MKRGKALLLVFALVLLAALAPRARARPGGGDSFGGGGDNDGLGEAIGGCLGASGGDPTLLLIGAVVVLVAWVLLPSRTKNLGEGWSTSADPKARATLEGLREGDPDFSLVLFEDFAQALFARAHQARGTGKLGALTPWLAEPVRKALVERAKLKEVKTVIVGAMRLTACAIAGAPPDGSVTVTLQLGANYTEVGERSTTLFVIESWHFRRALSARSRPPEKVRDFGCPSCGAALDTLTGNQCTHCQTIVDTGKLDWLCTEVTLDRREERGPQLTSEVTEHGTKKPTVLAADLAKRLAELRARDDKFTPEAFDARVTLIFDEFRRAWTARDLGPVRPYLSDQLYEVQTYWIDAYKSAKLKNVSEGKIEKLELARVVSDKWFDAVTVRVYASGLDYTVDEHDNLKAGSKYSKRKYSEYWTLIRGSGARGAARTDKKCPNCGADLKINMAGTCESCQAKVTAGAFDWVLSRIEQDEVYQA